MVGTLSTTEDGRYSVRFAAVDDRETAVTVSAGWHAGLEAFEAELDGRTIDWSVWDRSDELTGVSRRELG